MCVGIYHYEYFSWIVREIINYRSLFKVKYHVITLLDKINSHYIFTKPFENVPQTNGKIEKPNKKKSLVKHNWENLLNHKRVVNS